MSNPDPNPTPQRTHGQSKTTASRRRPAPNPQKVAQMLADSVELAPTVVIPLEVKTGSRNVCHDSPSDGGVAMINVTNREDGHEYLVLVIRK
jgi:hypothetical protein